MSSELNGVGCNAFKLARVFENDDAVAVEAWFGEQGVCEGRLARRGAPCDQNVGVGSYGVFQGFGERWRKRALIDIVTEFKRRGRGLADGKTWARRDRWEKPLKPLAAPGEFSRDNGGGPITGLAYAARDKSDDPFARGG